jgi:6-phosphogluconolactonase (cycloisomerase 2 family)
MKNTFIQLHMNITYIYVLFVCAVALGTFGFAQNAYAALSFVGGNTGTGNSAAFNVSLTSLTGGSDSSAAAGDLVIVVDGYVSTANGNPGVGTAGYTEVADLYASDSDDINLSVNWKIMSGTPDTTVSCNGSGSASNGAACMVYVWRGVDQSTPLDVTTTTVVPASNIGTSVPNPPSITPVTSGAVVIAIGGGADAAADTTVTAPAGYSNAKNASVDPSLAVILGIASKNWSGSGAEDPAVWTNWTTSAAGSWAAATMALRPAPAFTLSGTLYSDEGTTAITTTRTIKVAIGTTTPVSVISDTTDGSGAWSVTPSTTGISAGTPAVIWVEGDPSYPGAIVTRLNGQSTVSDLNLYAGEVIVRSEDGGAITVDDMATYDGVVDASIPYIADADSGLVRIKDGITFSVQNGKSFTGATTTVFAGDVQNAGTLDTSAGTTYFETNSTVSGSTSPLFGDARIGYATSTSFHDGAVWTSANASSNHSWGGLAYGNGVFVAVSWDGNVMTSPDGVTWTNRTAAEGNSWRSVVYAEGLFVAVASTGTNRVMTSPDGITWTARAAAQANTWESVTYGNGTFVAVSMDGTNRVMTSPDGITWTARSASAASAWYGVTYGDGLFVAVALNGTTQVMTSPDGTTWTSRTSANTDQWYAITYGKGTYVAVSWDGSIMTSADGTTWKTRTVGEAGMSFQAVTYADGLFVTVSSAGTHRVQTSPDGRTWTAHASTEGSAWQAVAYGDGTFVAVNYNGTKQVMVSTSTVPYSASNFDNSGTTWTARSAPAANSWRATTYGAGRFVSVSTDGTAANGVMYSDDGVTWKSASSSEASGWRALTYGNGLFVATAQTGTNRVMTSKDGIVWTSRSATEANQWRSITYGNGLFVSLADSGTNRVMTSPDGITWTARSAAAANGWASVAYGNGIFVGVSYDGTDRVMTSTDGITWTSRTAAENLSWRSVTFGNGTFVAVGSDGTNRVMTSTDGITWTGRSAAEANSWYAVTYGGGLFVAVASDGTHRVMTSPDGITWTARSASEANSWFALAYGEDTFVATAFDGTNRVMTSSDGSFTDTTTIFSANASTTDLTISASSTLGVRNNLTIYGDFTNNGSQTIGNTSATYVDVYDGTVGYDLANGSYDGVSLAVTETNAWGMDFSTDGTKLYVLGYDTDLIREFTLSTAWDISSASQTHTYSVAGIASFPNSVSISGDGTKIYFSNDDDDKVYQYTLSPAYDVSSASLSTSFSFAAKETSPRGLTFSTDGTKMYVSGFGSNAVHEYSLSSAWDVSSASFVQSFSFATQDTSSQGIDFSSDGTKLYMSGLQNDFIYEYELSTAWDISTAAYSESFEMGFQGFNNQQVDVSDDGTKMYALSIDNDRIYSYTIGTQGNDVLVNANKTFSGSMTGTDAFSDITFRGTGTTTFSNNASTSAFTIDSGAVVAAPSKLSVAGNIVNNGTLDAGSGTIFVTSSSTLSGNLTGTSALNDVRVMTTILPNISPSTATSSPASPLGASGQRKVWYDGTRWWLAEYSSTRGCAGHNQCILFFYSSDGTTWTENTNAIIWTGTQVSLTNRFSILPANDELYVLYDMDSDGDSKSVGKATAASGYPGTSFSWESTTTLPTLGGAQLTIKAESIFAATDGHLFTTFTESAPLATVKFGYASSTSAYDSTSWGNAATLETLGTTGTLTGSVITPLAGGDMYFIYATSTKIFGKKFTKGSGMQATRTTISSTQLLGGGNISAVSDTTDDEIYLAYVASSTGNVIFKKYTDSNTTWGATTTIDSNAGNKDVSLTLDTYHNDDLYAIWDRSGNVYYSTSSSPYTSWSSPKAFISSDGKNQSVTSGYAPTDEYAYFASAQGTTTPYNVRFAALSTTQPTTALFLNNASTSNLTISASSSVVAPSRLSVAGDYTNGGTFSNSDGAVAFTGGSAQSLSGDMTATSSFADVAFSGAGTKTFNDNASTSAFTIGSGATVVAPSALTITGNYSNSGTFTSGTGRIYFQGTTTATTTLTASWDVTTASYDGSSKSVSSQETQVTSLAFNSDGTKFYINGYNSDAVAEYSMTSAWDVTTASYVGEFSTASQDTFVEKVAFNDDGTKMYALGSGNDKVFEYSLSSAWDVTSASYGGSFKSVTTEDTTPFGMTFKPDGTRMYIGGDANDTVYSYTLSTPWDVTSASYDSISKSIAAQQSNIQDVAFNDDGTKMFIIGYQNDNVSPYTLSTPWDISTAVYDGASFSVSSQEATPDGLEFKTDGTKMYIHGEGSAAIIPYTLDSTTTISYAGTTTISGTLTGSSDFNNVTIDQPQLFVPDGVTWSAQNQSENSTWSAVTYGNGTFVALAYSGTNRVMTSTDGITWTSHSASQANSWNSVTYGEGLFVAVAGNGTNQVMTSPDGITWTNRSAAAQNEWYSVTYGNGQFVAVAHNNFAGSATCSTSCVMTSPDGITWTARTAAAANKWERVVYGEGLFVASASTGTDLIMTSPDGITWTSRNVPGSAWYGLAYGNGTFVAVAYDNVMTSPDGITWTNILTSYEANGWQSVTYGGGMFVAVSPDGTNQIMTSIDNGANWTPHASTNTNKWWDVVYGGDRFVAVAQQTSAGATCTTNCVMLSTSGDLYGAVVFANNASTTDLAITSGTIVTAPSNLSIAGDYSNDGTMDFGTGTTTFNGASAQTATGTLNGTSAFYNLRIINTSATTSFETALEVGNRITATGSAIIEFPAGATTTVAHFNVTGASGNEVVLRSTQSGTQWGLDATAYDINYVDVKDSTACNGAGGVTATSSIDSGNNDCWTFVGTGGGGSVTISSAANQIFALNQATTSISTITITDATPTATITAANDLRIAIATSTMNMRWNTNDTSATYSGTAAGKVSSTVSYEGGGSVLVIPVSNDFSAGDTLVISGLSFAQFSAMHAAASSLQVRTGGASDTVADGTDTKTIAITGSLTLADHDAGQVDNTFSYQNQTGTPIFAFKMTPAGENASVSSLTLTLRGIRRIDSSNLTNIKLYRDNDGSGTVDASDTQIGGAGALAITGQGGSITFSSSFSATTSKNYVVIADVSGVLTNEYLTIALPTSGITATGDTIGLAIPPSGSVTSVQHIRSGNGAGGGASAHPNEIGGDAPAGDGTQGGGGSDGGGGVGESDNGVSIGSEPGFYAPTATGELYNEWTGGSNALSSDGAYATAASANLRQSYSVFGFNVPAGNTVTGIEVKLEASGSTGAGTIQVALSWNGDSSITATKATSVLTGSDAVYTLGGASDTWGHGWTASELSNGNFFVRVIGQPNQNTVKVDAIQVKPYTQAGGGGSGGGGEI